MSSSLSADAIALFVAVSESAFAPLGGEERTRLLLERSFQESIALGDDTWNMPLSGGRAALTLEAEGRSSPGAAEVVMQRCAFEGMPCRLRLRIGNVAWIEASFLLQRFQFDAPQGNGARYVFTALSTGAISRTAI